MNRPRHMLPVCLVFVLAGACVCADRASAADRRLPAFDRLLPESTVAMVLVADGATMREDWDQSPLGRFAASPEAGPFVERIRSFWSEEIERPLAAESGVEATSLHDLFSGGFAVGILPPAASEDSSPGIVALFALPEDDDGDALGLIGRLVENFPESRESVEDFRGMEIHRAEFAGPMKTVTAGAAFGIGGGVSVGTDVDTDEAGELVTRTVLYAAHRDTLAVLFGTSQREAFETILGAIDAGAAAGADTGLAAGPAYRGAFQPIGREGVLRLFASPSAFVDVALGDVEAEAKLLIDAIGIRDLEGIAVEVGHDDNGDWTVVNFHMPRGKRGGLKLFDLHPVDVTPPPFVTDEVASYAVYGIDFSELYAEAMSLLGTAAPDALNFVRGMMMMAASRSSEPVDVERDIIEAFTPGLRTVGSYPRPFEAGREENLIVVSTDDASGIVGALRKLLRPSPDAPSMLEERDYLGHRVYTLEMPVPGAVMPGGGGEVPPEVPEIAMTTLPDALAWGTPEVLEAMLRRRDGSDAPLADSEPFRRALALLPEPSGYLEYTNTGLMMEYMLTVGMDLEKTLGGRINEPGPITMPSGREMELSELIGWLDLLPAPERVAEYFGVSVTVGVVTDDGLTVHSVSPHPAGD